MSSSTMPKSVQAQIGGAGGNMEGEATGSRDQYQQYREFIERYKQLPDDFLRIPSSYYPNQDSLSRSIVAREMPLIDMIDISVVEAQLVKNYGLLRMDLYCKIRVGHMVCETQTCLNGAKNPKWDGVYQFSLKPGIDSFHLEIYDEKQFSLDEKIAWLYEPIPPEVFQGITVERWFTLSGRLGPNKEGSVLLVLSHKRVPIRASNFGRAVHSHHRHGEPVTMFVPSANQTPITRPGAVAVDQQQIPAYNQPLVGLTPAIPQQVHMLDRTETRPISEEDITQLSEMFPSIDKAIIKAVLENNHNDKEAAIGALLALG